MPSPGPQSIKWPADRALLLVHGVGDAKPGDYDPLVAQLTTVLANLGQRYAIYMFYYDYVNEWFSEKFQAPLAFTRLIAALKARIGGPGLGDTIANFTGDVIWPILSLDARDAVRTALFRQLRQILLDGAAAGVPMPARRLSIICHSLGCFHVFEALHAAANDPAQQLGPAQGVSFDNVVFMASPVQLIGTVARDLGLIVPRAKDLACVRVSPLAMPTAPDGQGGTLPLAERTVAITGNLDPVGGYFFRQQLPWAYMNLPGQLSDIDQQAVGGITEADLEAIFEQALQNNAPPKITFENPHDWSGYIARHATELATWLA